MSIEWARLVLETIVSWPMAVFLVVIIFRKSILEYLPDVTKGKVGPFEWERAIKNVERATDESRKVSEEIAKLHVLSARTRIDEVEIWLASFGAALPKDKNKQLRNYVEEMKGVIEKIEQPDNLNAT